MLIGSRATTVSMESLQKTSTYCAHLKCLLSRAMFLEGKSKGNKGASRFGLPRYFISASGDTFRRRARQNSHTFSEQICQVRMPKNLAKVQKKIAKKKGTANSLHENSRDAQKLRRACARSEKLDRLAAARAKANQPHCPGAPSRWIQDMRY